MFICSTPEGEELEKSSSSGCTCEGKEAGMQHSAWPSCVGDTEETGEVVSLTMMGHWHSVTHPRTNAFGVECYPATTELELLAWNAQENLFK